MLWPLALREYNKSISLTWYQSKIDLSLQPPPPPASASRRRARSPPPPLPRRRPPSIRPGTAPASSISAGRHRRLPFRAPPPQAPPLRPASSIAAGRHRRLTAPASSHPKLRRLKLLRQVVPDTRLDRASARSVFRGRLDLFYRGSARLRWLGSVRRLGSAASLAGSVLSLLTRLFRE